MKFQRLLSLSAESSIVRQPADFTVNSEATANRGKHIGGRGGIRTHGTLAGTPVFKTGALNHSATLPSLAHQSSGGWKIKNGVAMFVWSDAQLVERAGARSSQSFDGGDLSAHRGWELAERDREQARAEQHEAGCGQREEAVRYAIVGHEIIGSHHTPATLDAGPNSLKVSESLFKRGSSVVSRNSGP
jgi:hypothetical protein